MKKLRNNKKKNLSVTVIILLILLLIAIGYGVYRNRYIYSPLRPAQEISQQASSTNTEKSNVQNQQNTSQNSNSVQQQPTNNTPPPQTPILTKSSGNNGSVPVGVLVNFICNSQPGTTCQIILIDGSKQISLTSQNVVDNGRGQWFASWDWKTIAGSWTLFARAKNSSGGESDSTKQTLMVK